jgi:hypothetical protein
MGGEHAQLVQKWGSDVSENLAYAKAAFKDIVTNRPDLIAKVEASGLGNDSTLIEFLAQHGRLQAGHDGRFYGGTKWFFAFCGAGICARQRFKGGVASRACSDPQGKSGRD